MLEQKNNSEKSTLARIVSEIQKNGYEIYLNNLLDIFGSKLWLVGGWLRNELFDNVDYVGDIDVLTCFSVIDIKRKLRENSINITNNNQGGMRIVMHDGNHIDIFSIDEFMGATNIEGALEAFNFSINAIALNIKTGQYLFTNQFQEDYSKGILRVNPCAYINKLNRLAMLKDFEVLRNYYRLNAASDLNTNNLIGELIIEKNKYTDMNLLEKMRYAKSKVNDLIPSNVQAWIVRGYLRCGVLSELEYWDDIDIVIDTNRSHLVKHLDELGCSYIWNYYSNPKVIFADGTKADIWCLNENKTIESEITNYSHNVDGMAWSIKDEQLIDPANVLSSIKSRELITPDSYIVNSTPSDISYAAMKTIYLCIRHKLTPKQSAKSLLMNAINTDGFLSRNCLKLVKELYCLEIDVPERFEALRSICGSSPAFNKFGRYLEPNNNIQRIAKSAIFLCYSLPLIITQKIVTFGNS